ncbi:MAG: metallophosphoesterase [Paludibacteraceae bacterium]|nr:metallophosphoesterase [Paludibacteraceae bacterium]
MMKRSYIFILAALFLLPSCSEDFTLDIAGMFSPNGETVNTRFEQSMAYNDSVGETHLNMGADEYVVYVCSDSHVTRNSHKNLDAFVAAYNAETAPKTAVHLGDIIDAQNNFACADSVIRLANAPFFITLGNHDIYFKQWSVFRSYFHTATYWFDTYNGTKKLDLFICLDSAEGTLGTAQTDWLRNLLAAKSKEGYRHIVIYTHTHFWKLDGSQLVTSNFSLEDTYELAALFAQYGVDYVWSGHQHARQSVFFKGVEYLVLDATKDKEKGQSYMTARMSDVVNYQFINY